MKKHCQNSVNIYIYIHVFYTHIHIASCRAFLRPPTLQLCTSSALEHLNEREKTGGYSWVELVGLGCRDKPDGLEAERDGDGLGSDGLDGLDGERQDGHGHSAWLGRGIFDGFAIRSLASFNDAAH